MARIAKYAFLSLFTILSSLNVYAEVNDSAIKTTWGYKGNIGPEYWAKLNPNFALCATGKTQSPVNIMKKFKFSTNFKLTVNYEPAPLIIMDDGPTSLQIGSVQTIINEGHGIQVNFHDEYAKKESIIFDSNTYLLKEIHFHSPSENQLHGRGFPLEIHFVHQGENGKLAVIGVFVDGGNPNPALQKIIDHLPKEPGKEFEIANEKINPLDLLPVKKNYYSFMGSLTTPPCSEGVQWILMDDVITASPAQILQLRQAANGANARTVQPLNYRAVTFSMEKIQ